MNFGSLVGKAASPIRLSICLAILGVSCASVEREQESGPRPTARAPLGMAVTEISPEDASEEMPQCLLCHANVVIAVMESPHAKQRIGCVTCHGGSIKHQSVEDNSIKPDRVIAKKNSATFCGSCHGWKGRAKGAFMTAGVCETFEPHQSNGACVDCHDAHTAGEKVGSDEK